MKSKSQAQTGHFPIRVLSARTGVQPSTLRSWERRFGLLSPRRTPKGHRLYSDADATLVARVKELVSDGHSISKAARLVKNGHSSLYRDEDQATAEAERHGQWGDFLAGLVRAVEGFSLQRLDAIYNEASSLYPLDMVTGRLIEPALQRFGRRWHATDIDAAEERFFNAWLRNKLGSRLHHVSGRSSDGPVLLLACVSGHYHDLNLMLFALAALDRGFRVVNLGSDMPFGPLPEVVDRCNAVAVVLAAGRELDPQRTLAGVTTVTASVDCPVFIVGAISSVLRASLDARGALVLGEQSVPAATRVATCLAGRARIRQEKA